MEEDYAIFECIVLVEEPEPDEGSKGRKDSSCWKDNARKLAKCEGRTYVNRDGKVVSGKSFVVVDSCCKQHCYKSFDRDAQYHLFTSFYASNKNKQAQDLYVASMIKNVCKKSATRRPCRPNRWLCEMPVDDRKYSVCQAFLRKIFQLSQKRIRIIQGRLLKNDSTFVERRGKHFNRPHKLSDDVLPLFFAHKATIPSEEQVSALANVFSLSRSSLNFTKKKLFESFQDFYREETGKELKMKYNTYARLYNQSK